ncbi:Prefoldin subunit-domain-containing protein [Lipomyces japonicus]|uniref:Prefoldin subunit-domain-containing protein n=1 Tax=Lipomyces japonicus TaxID=56871 RepID=UPI0034CDD257
MSLQLLPAGEESPDVQVSWEDQQKINLFSKLNARLSNLEEVEKNTKDQKEYLEEVSTEIELIDEDELVQYKIGEAFYWLKQAEVVEKLEQDTEKSEAELDDITTKMTSIKEQMESLKLALYAKFGNAINLER